MSDISKIRSIVQSAVVRRAVKFRRRRFALFRGLVARLERTIRIVDVGGEQEFWEEMGFAEEQDVEIVLANVKRLSVDRPNFKFVLCDARNLSAFGDGEFDIAFSNSVIEHLGDYAQQRRMAKEMIRIGRRCFLQTPNRYFPLEPHFLVPFFQFLPVRVRAHILTQVGLGWHDREPDRRRAEEVVKSIRLLTFSELRVLFPDAQIWRERILGLTKSFIVLRGW